VVGEGHGVVQHDADEEHGEAPSEGAEHPLVTVVIGVVAQERDDGRVRKRYSGRSEELTDDDQQEE